MNSTLPTIRRSLVEGWLLIVACTIIAGAAAVVVSLVQTKQYTASALLVFEDSTFDDQVLGVESPQPADVVRELETQVELANSEPVAVAAAERLGGGVTVEDIASAVSVAPDIAADTASVDAEDPDPERAAEFANAVAEAFVESQREALQDRLIEASDRLASQLESSRDSGAGQGTIRTLEERLANVETLVALNAPEVSLVERATLPTSVSSPRTTRNLAFGLVVGLLVGVVAALLRGRPRES